MPCSYQYLNQAPCNHKGVYQHDSKDWCVFHYPGPDHVAERTNAIQRHINRGVAETNMEGFRCPGGIRLQGTNVSQSYSLANAHVPGTLAITGTLGALNLRGLEVSGPVEFKGLLINASIDLSRAKFNDSFTVNESAFQPTIDGLEVRGAASLDSRLGLVSGKNAIFHEGLRLATNRASIVDLSGAQFGKGSHLQGFKSIDLTGATGETLRIATLQDLSTTVQLSGAEFRQTVVLERGRYEALRMDERTVVDGDLVLSGATFARHVIFSGKSRSLQCVGSVFENGVTLRGRYAADVNFTRAMIKRRLHAPKFVFNGKAEFGNAVLKECQLRLAGRNSCAPQIFRGTAPKTVAKSSRQISRARR